MGLHFCELLDEEATLDVEEDPQEAKSPAGNSVLTTLALLLLHVGFCWVCYNGSVRLLRS